MGLLVLGALELLGGDGEHLPTGGRRQETLLGLLAANPNRVISADRLAAFLWTDGMPYEPAAALHSQVSRLRRRLAPADLRVVRQSQGYLLAAGPEQLDSLRFERLVRDTQVEGSDPHELQGAMAAVLALWRGPAFIGLRHVAPLRQAALRLTEQKLSWLERVTGQLLRGDDPAPVIEGVRAILAEAPFREQAQLLLMAALDQAGRTAEAVEAYHAYRTALAQETGLDPPPAVTSVYLRLIAEPTQPAQPDLAEPTSRALALAAAPVPVTAIVGRERAADDVLELLRRGNRLVTLTGLGGVGKTRLALEVLHGRWLRGNRGDAAFVDLCKVRAADDVPDAVARALGVRLVGDDPVADLAAAIGPQRLLLVVDNFEPVLSAGALVADLLSRCVGVTVLATSRVPLELPGEVEYLVGPLAVPEMTDDAATLLANPAVGLFLDRVADRAALLGNSPDAAVQKVARVCRELDGMPLALELAAAATRFRSMDEVVDALLAAPGSALDALEAAIRWSFDRADPAAQRVFLRVCTFCSAFDPAAAQAVTEAPPTDLEPALNRLVSLGLLTLRHDDGRIRYSVPNLLAAYADRWLLTPADRAAADLAHLRYHVELCGRPAWLDDEMLQRIDERYPDYVRALRVAIAQPLDAQLDPPTIADLGTAMVLYWLWQESMHVALQWLDRLDERLGATPALAARLSVLRALVCREQGRPDEAVRLLDRSREAIDEASDPDWMLTLYGVRAAIADDAGDSVAVIQAAEAAVRLARRSVPRRLPEVLGMLAIGYSSAEDHERAARAAHDALDLLADVPSAALRAATRINATQALTEAGEAVVALAVLQGAASELATVPAGFSGDDLPLGWALVATGEHAAALGTFRGFLRQAAPAEQLRWDAEALCGCACALLGVGQPRVAALVLGGAERMLERLELRLSPWIRRRLDDVYAAVTSQSEGAQLVRAGAQLGTPAIIRLALEPKTPS